MNTATAFSEDTSRSINVLKTILNKTITDNVRPDPIFVQKLLPVLDKLYNDPNFGIPDFTFNNNSEFRLYMNNPKMLSAKLQCFSDRLIELLSGVSSQANIYKMNFVTPLVNGIVYATKDFLNATSSMGKFNSVKITKTTFGMICEENQYYPQALGVASNYCPFWDTNNTEYTDIDAGSFLNIASNLLSDLMKHLDELNGSGSVGNELSYDSNSDIITECGRLIQIIYGEVVTLKLLEGFYYLSQRFTNFYQQIVQLKESSAITEADKSILQKLSDINDVIFVALDCSRVHFFNDILIISCDKSGNCLVNESVIEKYQERCPVTVETACGIYFLYNNYVLKAHDLNGNVLSGVTISDIVRNHDHLQQEVDKYKEKICEAIKIDDMLELKKIYNAVFVQYLHNLKNVRKYTPVPYESVIQDLCILGGNTSIEEIIYKYVIEVIPPSELITAYKRSIDNAIEFTTVNKIFNPEIVKCCAQANFLIYWILENCSNGYFNFAR